MHLTLASIVVALGRWAILAALFYAVIFAILNARDGRARGRKGESDVTDIRRRRGA